MNSMKIGENILTLVEKTITTYHLLETNEKILLALSGGKDSIFCMLVLRELGFRVAPVIIDMGYEYGWGTRILGLAHEQGMDAQVVDVRRNEFQNSLANPSRSDLRNRLRLLDKINIIENENLTPCTQCYNVKIIALRTFAEKNGYDKIVFGHHGTDAIVSLLKSVMMYIDRWDNNHTVYSRHNYETLIEQLKGYFLNGYDYMIQSPIFGRIIELVKLQVASTDEPPLQYVASSISNLKIVRPLYEVFENEIKIFQINNSLETEGSGCGHGAAKDTETSREIIHRRVLDMLLSSKDYDRIMSELLNQTKEGLSSDGTLVVNARNDRDRILGSSYKLGEGCGTKL